jgi:type II secretory pathway component PulJ
MNSRIRGVTVLEVLIASGLLFSIILGSMWEFFRRSAVQSKELFEETSLAIEVERTLASLEREVFNSAYLLDAEGIDNPADQGYSGLVALNSQQPAVATRVAEYDCRMLPSSAPNAPDTFSVLRYTAINARLFPERTRAAWNESVLANANPTDDILYTYIHPADSQYVYENGTLNAIEVYLQDADARNFRRYQTLQVSRYQGPIDPATGAASGTTDFNYVTATLGLPHTFTGNSVTAVNRVFISSSSLFAATTKVTCIDSNGRLVQKPEYYTGAPPTFVLLDPRNTGHQFKSFEVGFGNLKEDRNVLIRNINFYNYNSGDPFWRGCQNVMKITMSFEELSTGKSKSFSRTFLINSKNLQRAPTCETSTGP